MSPAATLSTRRNGTAGSAMPIQTVDILLEEIGYPGWSVTMRINPRASVYDQLIQTESVAAWWKAFGQVVIDWNLTNEDSTPIPLPSAVAEEKDLDLPISLLAFVLTRYFEAVRAAAAVPKASSGNSVPTSSTSEGTPTTG